VASSGLVVFFGGAAVLLGPVAHVEKVPRCRPRRARVRRQPPGHPIGVSGPIGAWLARSQRPFASRVGMTPSGVLRSAWFGRDVAPASTEQQGNGPAAASGPFV
jgi:hypothetical protein